MTKLGKLLSGKPVSDALFIELLVWSKVRGSNRANEEEPFKNILLACQQGSDHAENGLSKNLSSHSECF